MENKVYRLSSAVCSMPARDADKLIQNGSGDAALLYIYLLRHGAAPTDGNAAERLGMDSVRFDSACSALRSLGLMSEPSAPPDELPEYSAEDIVARTERDGDFAVVLSEAESVLGKKLGAADMKTLFGIYDYLGMPTELIFLLLHYCEDDVRSRFGQGRKPTVRQIEKEAYVWANREIMTLDSAEEYIRARKKERDDVEKLRKTFGIRDRALTPTEKKYIDSWLSMGFPRESIELAFDRTVSKLGTLKWAYMNKILQSWYSKGLRTPEEIEKGDSPPRASSSTPRETGAPASSEGDMDRLRELYDKMRKG